MRSTFTCLAVATALAPITTASATDPAETELETYIAHVREMRMDGTAENQLRTVASWATARSKLTFEPWDESGRLWPTFESLSCPNPEMPEDILKEQAAVAEERVRAVVHGLHTFADQDSSGFVSAAEAGRLRTKLEFVYLAAQLSQAGEVPADKFCKASGLSQLEAEELLRWYADVYPRVEALGLDPYFKGSGLPRPVKLHGVAPILEGDA